MARKRYLSSEMSTDERLAQVALVDPVAALMWPWFVVQLDDWGRMIGSALKIKLAVFPAFPYTVADIQRAIELYAQHGLVHHYQAQGHAYLAVEPAKFYRYQPYIHVEKRQHDQSAIPAPTSAPWLTSVDLREDSRNPAKRREESRKIVPSPSPTPSPEEELKNPPLSPQGGGGGSSSSSPVGDPVTTEAHADHGVEAAKVTAGPQPARPPKAALSRQQQSLFDEFWAAYPKRRSKGQAEKAWAKLSPDEQLVDAILAAIERAKTSAEWRKQGGQYIPYPASWLNAKGWEDEHSGDPEEQAPVYGPGYVDFKAVAEHWERQMQEVAGKRGS